LHAVPYHKHYRAITLVSQEDAKTDLSAKKIENQRIFMCRKTSEKEIEQQC